MIPKLDIKERNFHGVLAVGALAGIGEGSIRYGFTLHTAFPGMVLTVVAAFLGGFTGFFIKDMFRTTRGLPPYSGINNDGWVMGAFIGTFPGLLSQLASSADNANLVVGAMAGAFVGAALGALPDEFVTPILTLMHARPSLPARERDSLR
jgi:outer membrane lipoprotein SlyB